MNLTIPSLLKAYQDETMTPRQVLRSVFERADDSDRAIWISRPEWDVIDQLLLRLEEMHPSALPLYGIPFAIKDNIDWQALPTTAACPAFEYSPEKSAFVVELLIAAGAIPVGKTNLDQFATGLVGVRSPYGVPANAFDADYIPGGSSSGSAVAVAQGLCSFSLGTDTAGSGRVPAAFNNLVGLKPTRGVLSCAGLVPACRTLDCISIFALTAADAATVFSVAGKFDPADAFSRAQRASGSLTNVIGVPLSQQLRFFGKSSAQALFESGVGTMRAAGFEVREVDFQPFLDAARLLYEGPWVAERYAAVQSLIEREPEALHPVTRRIIEPGRNPSAVDAFKAQYRLAELRRAADAVWDGVGAIMTPTAGTIYTLKEVEADPIQTNSNLGYYTNFMNLLDLCACAAPAGYLENGLPFGVTFIAPSFQDQWVLWLAGRFHALLDLPVGKTALSAGAAPLPREPVTGMMKLAVCGAHMEGLALNWQLSSRGGRFLARTTSAPVYKVFHLAGGGMMPDRPGMVRVGVGGAAFEVEVWELPVESVGGLLDRIPPPLCLGRVELADGAEVCGFLCEAAAVATATEITHFGGWRRWLASR